jgi:hypothetical protein
MKLREIEDWLTHQCRDDELVDRNCDDYQFVAPYLEHLNGFSQSQIEDPCQEELLEAIRRICQLAGILMETIEPEQIEAIGAMADLAKAKSAALDIIHANVTNNPHRRADLRQQVNSAARVKNLVQILWNVKMSNDGFKTGINTALGKKGLVYDR